MVTLKDVAKLAGVSASTVSRTLSGSSLVDKDTKQRVWKAVKQLGYRPNLLAKGLKEGHTNMIALLIPNIRNPIFPAVTRGVEDKARQRGYTLILGNTDEDPRIERDYIEKLTNHWIDGFILATATTHSTNLEQLNKDHIPIVFMIRSGGSGADAVVADNFGGAYEATKYLISRGHRRIALVNGRNDVELYRHRMNGYIQALKDHGIDVDEQIIVNDADDEEDGYKAMIALLDKGVTIDAVFATSDPKAIGVMKAIKDRGLRIPQDISIMGFDDLPIASAVEPALTTVSQPIYDMGAAAADKLIDIIEGYDHSGTTIMPTSLVIRQSVK